jgi:antitoxin component HigA of HigAB toxin-antitoxin module
MKQLKPKEWHEQFLAKGDKEKILQHLKDGQEQKVTRMAVALACKCDFFADFVKLWTLRVSDLDARIGSERYMERIYVDRRALNKSLKQDAQK